MITKLSKIFSVKNTLLFLCAGFLFFGLTQKTFAADTTLYVNTASTAGGDCTTNVTTGANRACASLKDAEAKLPVDITAAGGANAGIWTIVAEGQTADTQAVTFSGTVTDSTHYIIVTTSAAATYGRHQGIWSDSKYRLSPADATALNISDDYVKIDGLQITNTGPSVGARHLISVFGSTASNRVDISNSILRGNGDATWYQYGVNMADADGNLNIWNTLLFNFVPSLANETGIYVGSANIVNIYSSTIINARTGLRQAAGTVNCKNTYAGGGAFSSYLGTITKTTCASSDTSGSVSLQSIAVNTANFTNVTSGSENYHLPLGSALIGVGTDGPDAAPLDFTTDIDSQTRVSTWDIGADEYVVVPTYTIGGTVSGLSGTLVLQNNSGDNKSITENGAFTFATAINDGTTYSVTVLTQPNGLECTVTNGSGTVSGGNVTNVAVTCAVPDTTDPEVTTFSIPSTYTSITVPITSFTGSDNTSVTGYMATTTFSAPSANDSTWQGTAPTTYTFSSAGSNTLYAWVKDAAGNVSVSLSASVNINPIYYVDFDSGSDSNNGISTATAWKHSPGDSNATGNATATSLVASSTVIFKGGVQYIGTIDLDWSGSSGSPILYDGNSAGTWGTGKAIIGGDHSTTYGFYMPSGKNYLTFNNFEFYKIGGLVDYTGYNCTDNLLPSNPGYGFYLIDSSHITISNSYFHELGYWQNTEPVGGLVSPGLLGYGVYAFGTDNLVIENSEFTKMEKSIRISPGQYGSVDSATNVIIRNNNFHNYIRWMTEISTSGNDTTLQDISIYGNTYHDFTEYDGTNWTGCGSAPHTDGIILGVSPYTGRVYGSPSNPIRIYNNTFYQDTTTGGGTAMMFFSGMGGTVYTYNNTFVNALHGDGNIYVQNGVTLASGDTLPDFHFYNNTFYDVTYGIFLRSVSGANYALDLGTIKIKNNIFYRSGTSAAYNVEIYDAYSEPDELDYNLYLTGRSDQVVIDWRGNGGGKTVATAQTDFGWEAHGLQINPLFSDITYGIGANSSQNNLHLQSSSPAIGAGVDLSSYFTTDKDSVTRTTWDIGAYQYTAPTTYTITGTVSGLSGTVVLQNNSGDNESISSSGAFTFDTPLSNGASYAVTVLTQPSGQTCTVSNGSGTIASANVTNVSVTCTTNSTPATTSGGNGPIYGSTRHNISTLLATTTPPCTTSTTPIILTRNLSRGSEGNDVTTLQNFLVSKNFLTSDSVTGYFGITTETAVKAFQKSSGLVSSGTPQTTGYGNVGPVTRAKINSLGSTTACTPTQTNTVIPTSTSYNFARNLSLNMTGEDVRQLQQFLNTNGFTVSVTGAGSPGKETTLFGILTYRALVKFQKSIGWSGTGFFGPITRAYVNKK